eukprot:CCRYP_002900-RB/>CCRYP_002900-RB protein AED:0.32 eAED:0.38 QI:0/0/0/1/0/0.33/3/0/193
MSRSLPESFASSATLMGIRSAHANPALDTRVYEVHFLNGRTEKLAANVIAEVVYAQCDADGNQYVLLDTIVDYWKDPSVAVSWNDEVTVIDGKKLVTSSTKCWELCCKWKDGSPSWQKLTDLNESHPLQVANAQYHKWTHKYGIEFPKTVEEAYAIDRATGTTFWHDAIEKEMRNVCFGFDILADGVAPLADQ